MSNATYALSLPNNILSHGLKSAGSWLLHDYDDTGYTYTYADAQAASGDYFVTLATTLDKIAQSLPHDCAEQVELEESVNTLLYMQQHYRIITKPKSY